MKIAGGTDKLLVVRDVTSIVLNEQIMETKREMNKMTDVLMKQVDEHLQTTEQKLNRLDQFVQDTGKETIDESSNEIKKMQYRIKDFQQLYNISENKFYPNIENINVRKVLEELIEMLKIDLKGKHMEISLEIDSAVPENIQADLNKLRQVILNLFYQSVQGQIKGFIKFVVVYKDDNSMEPYVQVDIENSKFVVKARDAQRLNKLT